jgi:hypothetical protein
VLKQTTSLQLGVVNDDVEYNIECFDDSSTFLTNQHGVCQVKNASCLFLNEISKDVIGMTFYSTFSDAHSQLAKGKLIGILHIKSDFSEVCNKFLHPSGDVELLAAAATNIVVQLDFTNKGLAYDVQSKIVSAYSSFLHRLFSLCKISSKFLDSPLQMETPIHGSFVWDFRLHVAHILITL